MDRDLFGKESSHELPPELQSLLDQAKEHKEKVLDAQYRFVRRGLGDRMDDLLLSRQATVSAFSDSAPHIRAGALILEVLHWKPSWENDHIYRRICETDPIAQVKSAALSAMISLRIATDDRAFCQELAVIVRDGKDSCMRETAYIGLVEMTRDLRPRASSRQIIMKRGNELLNSIDWDLVNSFLREDKEKIKGIDNEP